MRGKRKAACGHDASDIQKDTSVGRPKRRSLEPCLIDAAIREFLDGLAEMIADSINEDHSREGERSC